MNHNGETRDARKRARLLLLGLELYNIGEKLRACPAPERDVLERRFLTGEREYERLLREIRSGRPE